QVVPAREASIELSSKKNDFTVTLSGTAPFGTGNPRYLMADNDATRTRIRVQVQSASIPISEDAVIAIDAPSPGTQIWEKDFDIALSAMKNGQIQFSTAVQLDRQWASKQYRVVITEYELHPFDPLRTIQLTRIGQPRSNQPVEWSERLVFMDIFEVNGTV
ncbi:MAG TPA: hypothetical protein VNV35_00605, partial [Puia sp.]|nr:hypothetical protein [Puia sp.]